MAESWRGLVNELVRERCRQKLTQEDMAVRMGCKRAFVSNIEQAYSAPNLITIMRYARALGRSLGACDPTPDPVWLVRPRRNVTPPASGPYDLTDDDEL